jgi:hypothetical protein
VELVLGGGGKEEEEGKKQALSVTKQTVQMKALEVSTFLKTL